MEDTRNKIYIADTKRNEVFVFEQENGYFYPVEKLVNTKYRIIKSIDITKYHNFAKPLKKSVFNSWKKRHKNFVKKHNRDNAIEFLKR